MTNHGLLHIYMLSEKLFHSEAICHCPRSVALRCWAADISLESSFLEAGVLDGLLHNCAGWNTLLVEGEPALGFIAFAEDFFDGQQEAAKASRFGDRKSVV